MVLEVIKNNCLGKEQNPVRANSCMNNSNSLFVGCQLDFNKLRAVNLHINEQGERAAGWLATDEPVEFGK